MPKKVKDSLISELTWKPARQTITFGLIFLIFWRSLRSLFKVPVAVSKRIRSGFVCLNIFIKSASVSLRAILSWANNSTFGWFLMMDEV